MEEQSIQSAKPVLQPSPTRGLLKLKDILLNLADVFKFEMTERAMSAYVLTVQHRTDEDLNRAYREVLRDSKFMPKPSELLEACGILRVRRDGSRPENE
jgi:hypothetical protein